MGAIKIGPKSINLMVSKRSSIVGVNEKIDDISTIVNVEANAMRVKINKAN